MRIQLWWCNEMKKWRWTLTKNARPIIRQESGQREDLRTAMQDIANTVEYLLETDEVSN